MTLTRFLLAVIGTAALMVVACFCALIVGARSDRRWTVIWEINRYEQQAFTGRIEELDDRYIVVTDDDGWAVVINRAQIQEII